MTLKLKVPDNQIPLVILVMMGKFLNIHSSYKVNAFLKSTKLYLVEIECKCVEMERSAQQFGFILQQWAQWAHLATRTGMARDEQDRQAVQNGGIPKN